MYKLQNLYHLHYYYKTYSYKYLLAYFLSNTRRISYDMVLKSMYRTGLDMHKNYRETSEGGLAAAYSRKGNR